MAKDNETSVKNDSPAQPASVEFKKDQVNWSDIKAGWNEFRNAEKQFEQNSKK
jgi:hypothetical protein